MPDVGTVIAGRYRLVSRIAVGGMGVVWEGWDELLARRVAVKQVLTQTGLSEADALLARHRVIREARITARLHHPHAVTIYDVVDDGDYPCLIMQFVQSSSLNGVLRERGTLPLAQVSGIGADLAAALHAAHEVGIVHRDVKPGNVLITDDGSATLTDFGISHAAGDVTLTSTGMVSGTPAYLAPEVARGGASGFPADVFSLGATLYASLEGAPPFGLDPNPMAVLHRVASGQLIPPQRSGSLTPLLLWMMAPDPANRPTMGEVSRTLALPTIPTITRAAPAGPPAETSSAQTVPVSRSDLAAASASAPASASASVPEPEPEPAPAPAPAPAPSAGSGSATLAAAPPGSGPDALADLMDSPPADTGAAAGQSRRRTTALFAAIVVLLAAGLTVGLVMINRDSDPASVAAPTQQVDATSPASESASSAKDLAFSTAPAPTTAPPTTAVTRDTAAQLSAAVSDYYALMPGNTDAGWARLTPNFQSGIAQNREYYDSFWAGVERVDVADVVGTPPATVDATVTYYFTDGSVSVEQTAYQLVSDGAGYKIDNSSVLTSSGG